MKVPAKHRAYVENQRGKRRPRFVCRGFLFPERIQFSNPEDYLDFVKKVWTYEEISTDLQNGILPPGMIIQNIGGFSGVVVPDGNSQTIVRIEEYLQPGS